MSLQVEGRCTMQNIAPPTRRIPESFPPVTSRVKDSTLKKIKDLTTDFETKNSQKFEIFF